MFLKIFSSLLLYKLEILIVVTNGTSDFYKLASWGLFPIPRWKVKDKREKLLQLFWGLSHFY
jgi:hypothetical protein